MGKSLLLLSKESADREFAAEVSLASGLSLRVTGSAKEVADAIGGDETAVVIVDASNKALFETFESTLQEVVGLFSEKINAGMLHYVSALPLNEMGFLIQSPIFGSYLQRPEQEVAICGRRYGRLIKASLEGKAFGLGKMLAEGTKIQVVKLAHSRQKQEAVEAVKKFLVSAKFPTRSCSVIANAVDELLMNAIFDAPVDSAGKQIHAALPRTAELELSGGAEVEMHVGFDGSVVGITAVDRFGSLDKQRLMSHLSKVYVTEEYKVRTTVAGAGIGLANVFQNGGSFLFSSDAHARTEATVFFQRTENYKSFKDQFKFISTHFYF